MRILYITLENLSLHKGSVVHIKEVIEGLQKHGHQVGLIGRAWTKLESGDHFYNIHPQTLFPSKFLNPKKKSYVISSILLFLTLIRILRKYDIIYARDFHTVIIALLPRLILRRKLVFEINGLANEEQKLKGHSFHNQILAFLIKRVEGTATRCCDRIVSVTQQISNYLMHSFHCRPEKIRVIGNGVNTKRFHPIHDDALLWTWRKRLGITKEDVVIAFVGNLAPWQGVNMLIESALRLLPGNENLKFLIVGEGLLRDSLEERVFSSGYGKNFIFTGMIQHEDIPFLNNIADICVAPFGLQRNQITGTGSPIKIFEYLACGKPVVTSRFADLEFIELEGVGYLTEPEDMKDFQDALYDLIRWPHERMRMGQRGLELAREKFSWESCVTKIEKVLIELA